MNKKELVELATRIGVKMPHYTNTAKSVDFPAASIDDALAAVDVSPKIKKLVRQANCRIDRLGFGEGNLERLILLTLKECYAWSKENGGLSENCDYQALKEHFGVE